jgi:hypothetical protein
MKYSNGFRARMVQRMVGPEGIGAIKLAEEIGAGARSLYLRDPARISITVREGRPRIP